MAGMAHGLHRIGEVLQPKWHAMTLTGPGKAKSTEDGERRLVMHSSAKSAMPVVQRRRVGACCPSLHYTTVRTTGQ